MKVFKVLILLSSLLISSTGFSQRGHGHGHHKADRRGKTLVVRHSHYRPRHVVVYHPHWRPAYSCNRRWVYFPRHNFYWDNWRNHYVFYNGAVWVSQANAPTTIVNINLQNEKTVELNDTVDDVDDVYKMNDQHKTVYKSE